MRIIIEGWTGKYKKSIDCNNPKGFSQKAHCAGRKARQAGRETKSKPVEEERIVVPEDLKEAPPLVVVEKKKLDRCARLAKSKYEKWPSAYASGAVVRCRQGKIWKGLEEEEKPVEEEKKKRKYKPSFTREKEEGLHGWFARNRGKGWVNCRTGGPCGRESADGGGKYPACRPTLAQCKSAGRGPLRKKKSSKPISWTNEGIEMKLENLILEEFRNVKLELMSEGMRYHVETKTSLYNPIYRPGSKAFATLMNEARELYEMGQEFSLEEKEMLEGDCGKYGMYEGKKVPLEYPMVEEELDEAEYKGKDVPIGKPQRGGSKKFYVYVKDGDRVKKISFGDPNLSVKVGDPKRRASFVARHRCTEKNDRLTAGYWSCRIGRYPHLTGAKQRYTWW